MKILCLVPSITETLIECKVDVVGRTRFCIHPAAQVEQIPAVAGTKDINWLKIEKIQPDLVIFDKEENTLEMANSCPYPYIALHILSVDNVGEELQKLANKLDNKALNEVANRWQQVSRLPAKQTPSAQAITTAIPAVINPVGLNTSASPSAISSKIKHIDYMIWKNPWMAIGPDTFIWSMLEKLGFTDYLIHRADKYPNLGDEIIADPSTYYLFSSEPFPFERYQKELAEEGFNGVVIDGESYSWYGIRSLVFLEALLN
jgi:ABC-type Fe3+-hydroxamate transport system substrate-binding protein